ncbi:hypothetical protein D3C81_465890 [compost metagenome]
MPATLPMPTRRPLPCACMLAMKGAKVATVAVTLMAIRRAKASRSSACSLKVPYETPALAMTTSMPPAWPMKSAAAFFRAAWSHTSTA